MPGLRYKRAGKKEKTARERPVEEEISSSTGRFDFFGKAEMNKKMHQVR